MQNTRASIWRSAAGLVAMALTTAVFAQGGGGAAVRVDAARVEQVQHHRQVTGNLRAVARSRVAASESGIVLEAPLVEGQFVGKGDVLARLDDRRIVLQLKQVEAELSVLEATLAEREAQLRLNESDLEMYDRISDRGAVNPKEMADARLQVNIAAARRDQAMREIEATNAAADLLRRRLADTVVRAPFDGVVTSRIAEVGEWVAQGQAIAEVVAVGSFEVWLDVPQRLAPAASAKNRRIGVLVEATDREYESSSVRVIREVDPLARTFSLIVQIEDEDDLLSPGMSAVAWLPTSALVEHVTIHKDAVLRGETGAFVFAVRQTSPEQSQAVAVPVHVLFDVHDRVVIRSGPLMNGDLVVVEGNERLNSMQPVQVVEDGPQPEDTQALRD